MMLGRDRGFTLVELLVVIAVVAILAMLTLGGLSKVNAMRDRTESASRLRQWGAALGGYMGDHNGELPRRGQGVQVVTQFDRPEDWFNALPPYLGIPGYKDLLASGRRPREGERSIFVRPGAKDPGTPAFLSYAMNMNLSPWNLSTATRMAQIEHPAAVVFMAESPGAYASTYPSTRPYSCQAPFDGKGNVLFLDGHIVAYSAEYIGVGKGDPHRSDVSWLTGTPSDAGAESYR